MSTHHDRGLPSRGRARMRPYVTQEPPVGPVPPPGTCRSYLEYRQPAVPPPGDMGELAALVRTWLAQGAAC